jgi:integrase
MFVLLQPDSDASTRPYAADALAQLASTDATIRLADTAAINSPQRNANRSVNGSTKAGGSARRERVHDLVSIFLRGRVYWAEYRVNGKQQAVSLRTQRKPQARLTAQQIGAKLSAGDYQSPKPRVAIRDLVCDLLDVKRGDGAGRSTIEKYAQQLERFCGFADRRGIASIDAFRAVDFDAFRSELREVLHPSTAHDHAVAVKMLCNFAESREFVDRNPLRGVRLVEPVAERRRYVPTSDEIRRLLDAAKKGPPVVHQLLAMLAYTGARANEACALRPSDVDLARSVVCVPNFKRLRQSGVHHRVVPIHPILRPTLEAALSRAGGDAYLFMSRTRAGKPRPFNDRTLLDHALRFAAAAGIPVGRLPSEHGGKHRGGSTRTGLTPARAVQAETTTPRKLGRPPLRAKRKVDEPAQQAFVVHSLRHAFVTICESSGVSERVYRVWVGHTGDRGATSGYFDLKPDVSQRAMATVQF